MTLRRQSELELSSPKIAAPRRIAAGAHHRSLAPSPRRVPNTCHPLRDKGRGGTRASFLRRLTVSARYPRCSPGTWLAEVHDPVVMWGTEGQLRYD